MGIKEIANELENSLRRRKSYSEKGKRSLANRNSSGYIRSIEEYQKLYQISIENPDTFWKCIASKCFYFHDRPDVGKSFNFNFDPTKGKIFTEFLPGWTTNACYNCVDRHCSNGNGERIAFYWEGNDPRETKTMTYSELLREVSKFSNGLKSLGVKKGDVVAIYMPMVIDLAVAMLACARIGAVHTVVFAGFSSNALADRLVDANVKVVLTADGFYRGSKFVPLKAVVNEAITLALENGHKVDACVHLNTSDVISKLDQLPWEKDWVTLLENQSEVCDPVWVESEHPLFILYTSGSSGKPKGIVHTTAGYLVYASTNFKYSFDFHPKGDVFFGTSDMGWCCAHTNIIYGPLSLGGSTLLYSGSLFHPNSLRVLELIEKYQVTTFYTAPSVLRNLVPLTSVIEETFSLSSLKVLGTVGEPMSSQLYQWYEKVIGRYQCPIVDTYGQTETGGHLITSIPFVIHSKPGTVGVPFFGCDPVLVTRSGEIIEGMGEGCLAFRSPWPCIFRTVLNSQDRYEQCFSNGFYYTGDAAFRDAHGFYTITGRVDDMLNVNGHLLSLVSIENAASSHSDVQISCAVAVPHALKGECIYLFVVPNFIQQTGNERLLSDIKCHVKQKLGAFAVPDEVIFTPVLPLTRTGKVVRRILGEILKQSNSLGDTSSLADPSVLPVLNDLCSNNLTQPSTTMLSVR